MRISVDNRLTGLTPVCPVFPSPPIGEVQGPPEPRPEVHIILSTYIWSQYKYTVKSNSVTQVKTQERRQREGEGETREGGRDEGGRDDRE